MRAVEKRPGARVGNLILGLWLLASAFEWPHTGAQTTNGAVVGALSIVAALLALRADRLRWVTAALGAWLLVGTWALPHAAAATEWSNSLVAIAMVLVSLVPGAGEVALPAQGQASARA